MQRTSLSLLVLLFVAACFAQTSPDWYAKPQFLAHFDYSRQAEDTGIPFTGQAAGWMPAFQGYDGPGRREAGLWHARGGLYFAIMASAIRWQGLPHPGWEAYRMRTLDGGFTDTVDHLHESSHYSYTLSAKEVRDDAVSTALRFVDLGADGIVIDDASWQIGRILNNQGRGELGGSFDAITMDAFRVYLQGKYDAQTFQTRFAAALDSFDYGAYIRSQGNQKTWNAFPLSGLALEFLLFRREESLTFLRGLAETTKSYARERYGREFLFSVNGTNDPNAFFYRDFSDLNTSELSYIRGMDHPYGALDIKAARGWKEPMVVVPIAMVREWGATNPLSKPTVNLERVMLADIYAAGGVGGATLSSLAQTAEKVGGAAVAMNAAYSNPQPVDFEVVARYASFALQNPQLITQLKTPKKLGLLQGASAMLGNTIVTPGQPNAADGRPAYVGTARLLIDGGFSYDSIFLPDTSYSTLPSPSVDELARYQTLIAPSLFALDDNQVSSLLGFAEQGGTLIVLGAFATNNSDHSAATRGELQALLSKPGAIRYGEGRIVYSSSVYGVEYQQSSVSKQRSTRAAFQAFLSAYTEPEVAVDSPEAVVHEPGVTPYFYTDRNGNVVVHLVNYDYDDESDQFYTKTNLKVTVNVGDQDVDEVILRTPDSPLPQSLSFTRSGSSLTIDVPEVEAWAVLALQKNAAAPEVASASPAAELEAGSGSTVELSVDASDGDGNPLSCVWTVNGEIVPAAFGLTYLLKLPASAQGDYTVWATVTDGTQTTQRSWLIHVQARRQARVLFDETHWEISTFDAATANQISPGHPDWVSLAVLAEILRKEHEVSRLAGSYGLSAAALRGADVVVLAQPRWGLSTEEARAVTEFVQGGGGVLYLFNANTNMVAATSSILEMAGIGLDKAPLKSPNNTLNQAPDSFYLSGFAGHPAIAPDAAFHVGGAGSLILSGAATPLAWTSDQEWRSISGLGTQQPDEPNGPFVVVAGAELGQGRIVVMSSNTFTDGYLGYAFNDGNVSLFRSVLTWLAEPSVKQQPAVTDARGASVKP
ncbi:hypothetical protein [Paludibaculum fermentans]|uniref:hypothetical protein n=1 Tax=Paludibaculum fermentans TaxID=1473598 RepID=UPI003EB9417F